VPNGRRSSNCGPVAAKIPQTPFLNSEVTEPIFLKFLENVGTLVPLLMCAFSERYCFPFHYARPKSESNQFWNLQKTFKLIGYHSNVSFSNRKINTSFIIPSYMTTNAESWVKIGSEVAEIFGGICQFLPSFFLPSFCKNSTISLLKPQSDWTDLHHFCIWRRGIRAAFSACIHRAILHSVSECQSEEWKQSISTSAKSPRN